VGNAIVTPSFVALEGVGREVRLEPDVVPGGHKVSGRPVRVHGVHLPGKKPVMFEMGSCDPGTARVGVPYSGLLKAADGPWAMGQNALAKPRPW
jgi:hypothetical protein